MRPFHLILAASLLANALTVAAYFLTRRTLEREAVNASGALLVEHLSLSAEQAAKLQETRSTIRSKTQTVRREWQELFDTAVAKVREAKPGDTSFEAAVMATGEARRRQTVLIIRELIAFREHLTPPQRETFNRHLHEWAFIEALMGLPPDSTKSTPSGPFRGGPASPPRSAR